MKRALPKSGTPLRVGGGRGTLIGSLGRGVPLKGEKGSVGGGVPLKGSGGGGRGAPERVGWGRGTPEKDVPKECILLGYT